MPTHPPNLYRYAGCARAQVTFSCHARILNLKTGATPYVMSPAVASARRPEQSTWIILLLYSRGTIPGGFFGGGTSSCGTNCGYGRGVRALVSPWDGSRQSRGVSLQNALKTNHPSVQTPAVLKILVLMRGRPLFYGQSWRALATAPRSSDPHWLPSPFVSTLPQEILRFK